jgi:hypothetical protein
MTAYPTARLADATAYISAQPEGQPPVSGEVPITWMGDDPKIEVAPLERVGREAFEECLRLGVDQGGGNKRGEDFEGGFAPKILGAVADVPPSALTDRGFWRYFAVGPMYEAVRWRHGHGNLPGYGCSPSAQVACLPWRLFMRAAIGFVEGSDDPYRLSRVKGTDLWWSHILRIEIGRSRPTAQALLEIVDERSLKVDQIRELAPRITRLRSTVLFEALSNEEIATHISDECH